MRHRIMLIAAVFVFALSLLLVLQAGLSGQSLGVQRAAWVNAEVLAQAATATPEAGEEMTATTETTSTESITASEEMTAGEEMTPGEETPAIEEMSPAEALLPAIGIEHLATISPTQVFSGAALQPGASLPVSAPIALVKVADGLVDPVNVVGSRDGTGRLFVVQRNGVVRIVMQEGQLVEEPFLDISDMTLTAFLEQGLYDLEFHPDYTQNGRFFVHFAEILRNGDSMIVEYRVSADSPDVADQESPRVIMQIEQPWANHNGGELAFGPDGYLYIGSGDGGWEGDPLSAGQDLGTLLGKVLRIDVDVEDGRPYAIPEGNPFAASQSPTLVQLFGITEQEFSQIHTLARPEIWAYGLRNPWKFQFDRLTGDLYLPDVGQNHWEEINFQPANSTGGENYGWDFLMGTHCFPLEAGQCGVVGVLPVAEYNHQLGCTVIGMGVYRGDAYPNLNGIYFSGDFCSGRIWGLMRDEEGAWAYAEVLDTNLQFTGAGEGEDGAIYVTSCHCNYGGPAPEENPPGSLWRIVPADQVPEGAETAPVQ